MGHKTKLNVKNLGNRLWRRDFDTGKGGRRVTNFCEDCCTFDRNQMESIEYMSGMNFKTVYLLINEQMSECGYQGRKSVSPFLVFSLSHGGFDTVSQ